MVQAIINFGKEEDQIITIVKGKYGLRTKSEAVNLIVEKFGQDLLEPELRPEYVEKIKKVQKEPTVKIKDFKKHFGVS